MDFNKFNSGSSRNRSNRLGDMIRESYNIYARKNSFIYVDASVSQSGNGSSWKEAVKTIQEGVNLARYAKGTTSIEGDSPLTGAAYKKRDKYVFVAPGQYNERVLFSGYNIHLIGVQQNIGNVDWGVVVNYDGAVASTCVLGFTGAGIEIANLQINCSEAIPAIWAPSAGDGCYIHDCVIKCDGTNATHGIAVDDCRKTIIENNRIENAASYGISVGEGAASYFHTSIIRNNYISGAGTAAIYVDALTTAAAGMGSFIHSNRIVGSYTTGIHQDNAAAYVLIDDNTIQAGTAITDDGAGTINNFTAA